MKTETSIAITTIVLSEKSLLQAEICEHKGIGHPDSICDGVAEAASQALCRAYLAAYGVVQHHNVDKALLIGGESEPRFGGGKIRIPIRLIICGRATPLPARQNVKTVIQDAAHAYLQRNLHIPGDLIELEVAVRSGSADLEQVFSKAQTGAIANDTSFGVGYAPLSELEQMVLEIAELMKSTPFRAMYPVSGDDYKIMGKRLGVEMEFILALAFVDRHVASAKAYDEIKLDIRRSIASHLGNSCSVRLNTLDSFPAHTEKDVYLTVSGLSGEHGDDGQVGRGNRVNGLITPSRTMSLEAAAGKNPVCHVGKIYNVLAHEMAEALSVQLPDIGHVSVQLLSAIGMPVNRPQLVNVEIIREGKLTPALQKEVQRISLEQLANIDDLSRRLIEGRIRVF